MSKRISDFNLLKARTFTPFHEDRLCNKFQVHGIPKQCAHISEIVEYVRDQVIKSTAFQLEMCYIRSHGGGCTAYHEFTFRVLHKLNATPRSTPAVWRLRKCFKTGNFRATPQGENSWRKLQDVVDEWRREAHASVLSAAWYFSREQTTDVEHAEACVDVEIERRLNVDQRSKTARFWALPQEIRDQIWRHTLSTYYQYEGCIWPLNFECPYEEGFLSAGGRVQEEVVDVLFATFKFCFENCEILSKWVDSMDHHDVSKPYIRHIYSKVSRVALHFQTDALLHSCMGTNVTCEIRPLIPILKKLLKKCGGFSLTVHLPYDCHACGFEQPGDWRLQNQPCNFVLCTWIVRSLMEQLEKLPEVTLKIAPSHEILEAKKKLAERLKWDSGHVPRHWLYAKEYLQDPNLTRAQTAKRLEEAVQYDKAERSRKWTQLATMKNDISLFPWSELGINDLTRIESNPICKCPRFKKGSRNESTKIDRTEWLRGEPTYW